MVESTSGTGTGAGVAVAEPAGEVRRRGLPRGRGRDAALWLLGTLLVAGGAAGLAVLGGVDLRSALRSVGDRSDRPQAPPPSPTTRRIPGPPTLRSGRLSLDPVQVEALGLVTTRAVRQQEPTRVELLGKTAYRTDAMTRVRPLFKGRLDRVHVSVGGSVRAGDPLVDLFSTDLALAKNDYRVKQVQWEYDKRLLETHEDLHRSNAVSRRLYEESRSHEMKSRLAYQVARDTLQLYGLSDAEIAEVDRQDGAEKARLTLRAPADGVVIERAAVPGNLYDENDVLLVVAPIDRLWVWGDVFEVDLDLVSVGQTWEIRFPFLDLAIDGRVEYVSGRVDPETHAVKIRTSIPNPGGRLKSEMLVRGMLEVPPVEGRVVVPRSALIVSGAGDHVFVRADPGDAPAFERRTVTVVQEKDEHAVLAGGVRPDESVVTVGGLILAESYEQVRRSAGTGDPPAEELSD